MLRMGWTALLLGAAMCETEPGPVDNDDVPTPSNPNTQTINGTLDCTEAVPVPDPGEGGNPVCVVEPIGCGDVIQGNNEGGTLLYDRAFWNDAMELGALATEPANVLDGPERVYSIVGQPPDTDVVVTVTSCVQLWASWRRHGDTSDDWCDAAGGMSEMGHFTGPWQDKTYTLINRSSGEYDWEIIVDSWNDQVGNYTIQVDCYPAG